MARIVVSLWLLPAPGGARVSSRKMTPAEAALAGAVGIVPNSTSIREVPDDPYDRPPVDAVHESKPAVK